jgi:hypothetical protein
MSTSSNPSARGKSNKRYASTRRKRKQNPSTLLWIIGGVGLIALAVFLVARNTGATVGPIEGVQNYANLDRSHTTEKVNYNPAPPVGGAHAAAWLNCGVYTAPVSNENAVHSLEHGAIWITYQPELAGDELASLQTLTRQSSFRLLSPYPGLDSPIVASAWGYQLKLDRADDPRLADFIEKYEQNPLGPEPGAACTGGVGTPG